MDNNFEEQKPDNSEEQTPVYTDPNGDASRQDQQKTGAESYSYGAHQGGAGYSQNGYQSYGQNYNNQNYYNQNYNQNMGMDTSPLSLGEWLLTLLVGVVPCVGLILYMIWAFGAGGNVNRKNFCRAYLIMEAIGLIIVIIFLIGITAFGVSGYYYY